MYRGELKAVTMDRGGAQGLDRAGESLRAGSSSSSRPPAAGDTDTCAPTGGVGGGGGGCGSVGGGGAEQSNGRLGADSGRLSAEQLDSLSGDGGSSVARSEMNVRKWMSCAPALLGHHPAGSFAHAAPADPWRVGRAHPPCPPHGAGDMGYGLSVGLRNIFLPAPTRSTLEQENLRLANEQSWIDLRRHSMENERLPQANRRAALGGELGAAAAPTAPAPTRVPVGGVSSGRRSMDSPHGMTRHQPAYSDGSSMLYSSSPSQGGPLRGGGGGGTAAGVSQGIGLRLAPGLVVQEIVIGSPSAACGAIAVNDRILEVNGQDVTSLSIPLLRPLLVLDRPLILTLLRDPAQVPHQAIIRRNQH